MKHALITRFAIRFAENNPRRRYEKRNDWLGYRMKLFQKYTLPSVQAQTFKDFDWWIVVDPEFPGLTSRHLNQFRPYAQILCIDAPWRENQEEIGEALQDTYKDEWVCSTRLDSDDVISNDFMANVARMAEEQETWISFSNGYMMKGDKVVARTYLVNPFVSHVEYAAPFKSVFRVCHTKINKQKAPLVVDKVRSWIQVDHSDNIKNLVGKKIGNFDEQAFSANSLKYRFTWSDK